MWRTGAWRTALVDRWIRVVTWRGEPPSACGISPRRAGGEGIRATSSPVGAGGEGIRATSSPVGAGGEGIRATSSPAERGGEGIRAVSSRAGAGGEGIRAVSSPAERGGEGIRAVSSPAKWEASLALTRRWLPRVGAAGGGGGGRAAAHGSLPLSRCATAPPRGERLDRVVPTAGWQGDWRAPFGGGSPEWELPEAEGEAVRRPRLAGLGASPSVAARQLPLGGSDWIGLLGGGCLDR